MQQAGKQNIMFACKVAAFAFAASVAAVEVAVLLTVLELESLQLVEVVPPDNGINYSKDFVAKPPFTMVTIPCHLRSPELLHRRHVSTDSDAVAFITAFVRLWHSPWS